LHDEVSHTPLHAHAHHLPGHGTILFAQAIAETLRAAESGSTAKLEVPLAATLEDGLYVQTVIDACRRSNELGTWVNV
jgi:predicted dehydrogenase